jgi:hypothetical protein
MDWEAHANLRLVLIPIGTSFLIYHNDSAEFQAALDQSVLDMATHIAQLRAIMAAEMVYW